MKLSLKLLPLAMTPLLAACPGSQDQRLTSTSTPTHLSTAASTPTSGIKSVPCPALAIVQLSRRDTTGTKAQVEANNAVIEATCATK